MGTNYYARYEICESCDRYEEEHIGKSSAGWTFSFHATDEIRSYVDWLTFLNDKDVKIFDEIGAEISLQDFKKMVETKQKEERNHAPIYTEGSFKDDEGHSFSEDEFS